MIRNIIIGPLWISPGLIPFAKRYLIRSILISSHWISWSTCLSFSDIFNKDYTYKSSLDLPTSLRLQEIFDKECTHGCPCLFPLTETEANIRKTKFQRSGLGNLATRLKSKPHGHVTLNQSLQAVIECKSFVLLSKTLLFNGKA